MKDKNGGYAFPVGIPSANDEGWLNEGMTLRDYFAAKAMQGIFSNTNVVCFEEIKDLDRQCIPEIAYGVADAMLEVREKDER